ncbi:MAG: RNA polymerase sigma factor SigA [Planctomycetota bacterium]|nr:MAG: RNA polymerase sigma factor SigA [Planctomycetota bacterium]
MRSNLSSDQDLVKVYLHQMSRIPPISVEEERVLAGDLERTRNTLREKILQSGIAIARAIKILERVAERKLPIDRALLVDVSTSEAREGVLARIPPALEQVRKHLATAQRRFRAYLKEDDTQKMARLRARVREAVDEAVRHIDPFHIQVSLLEGMYEDTRAALRRIKAAERKARSLARARGTDPRELEQARQRLVELQVKALATPKMLRRYVAEVRQARQAYDEAKKRLSAKNLRLVVSIAKAYRGKGLPFLDLIQEGNTGLMKALDRYQASRGNKFSTYATWWIKQTITRSIAYQSRTVRIPIHAINNLSRLIEERENFIKREGRDPTIDEMAQLSRLPPQEVNRLFELNRTALSLDQPYGSGEDCHFGDLIEDQHAADAIEQTQKKQLRDRVHRILKELSHREREVLRLRYGLDDGTTHTLEEVGKRFKVSRERIRQIEVGALQKLQLPVARDKLRAFWEEINS